MTAFHRYGGVMTYTLKILKMPERRSIEDDQRFDTLEQAIAADDFDAYHGGSFVAEITNDDTGEVFRERKIANQTPAGL